MFDSDSDAALVVHSVWLDFLKVMIIIVRRIAVISVAPCLTNTVECTALYKINKNVHIKTSKIIILMIYIVLLAHAPPPPPHTHIHSHTRARTHKCAYMHSRARTHTHNNNNNNNNSNNNNNNKQTNKQKQAQRRYEKGSGRGAEGGGGGQVRRRCFQGTGGPNVTDIRRERIHWFGETALAKRFFF